MAAATATSQHLIAGRFAVDPAKPLPNAGGGLPAFVAHDRQLPSAAPVAIMVSRDSMPDLHALEAMADAIDDLMTPLGAGTAPAPDGKGEAYYIVYSAPPGPPLAASLAPWSDRALMDHLLRPAAKVLATLHKHRLTHRAIRLNNMFQGAAGQPVTIGAAWSAAAAVHQPALFESPYIAMCHKAARGKGTIADDIYSLGVVMLILAAGQVPMDGLDDDAIIRAKLEHGCYEALTRNLRLSPFAADLARAMLAEESEHRPTPALLLDPAAARARRVAARMPRRAQIPLVIGDMTVSHVRGLAYALLRDEKKGIQALRSEAATSWLRRSLGDGITGSAVEEVIRTRTAEIRPKPRSDSQMLMRAIAVLNPRMPLCWRGVALMPDGIDGLLAQALTVEPDLLPVAEELWTTDVIPAWLKILERSFPRAALPLDEESQDLRSRMQDGDKDAALQMFYYRNPLLPCRLPTMASQWIYDMRGLVKHLEAGAGAAKGPLVDADLLAFIAARDSDLVAARVRRVLHAPETQAFVLAELGMIRGLQARHHPEPLPNLGKWMIERLKPELGLWRNRHRRKEVQEALLAAQKEGNLTHVLALATDPAQRQADEAGLREAVAEAARIDAEIRSIDEDGELRFAAAQQMGAAITAAVGLTALVMIVLAVVAP